MSQLTKSGVFLLLCCFALSAPGQPREMVDGTHFATIDPPLATRAAEDTIEILDVFWYGCPQCEEFEPMMTYYGGQIRGDLVLRRMPAVWNPVMQHHARVYFTAVALGIAQQAHAAAFRYVQEQRMPLDTTEQAQHFFSTLGVKPADFELAWHSDMVSEELALAQTDTTAAGITRVPALVVNGRYRVVRNASVPELPEVIVIANQLISVLRGERRTD